MSEKVSSKQENIVISIIKSIVFWIISLLFLEVAYRLIMGFEFNTESIINIVLYSVILGSIYCIFSKVLDLNFLHS